MDARGGRLLDGHQPSFEYLGLWQTNSTGLYTIYPGSQVGFRLQGKARLAVHSGMPETIHAQVRSGGTVLWDGFPGQGDIAIDAGTSAVPCSVVYLATCMKGFDTSRADAAGAELRFDGITLEDGASLEPPRERRNGVLFEFLGDSITAGDAILGRSSSWAADSDATLTYAFRLAESLHVGYRIRAFPGAKCDEICRKFPFARRSIPIAAETPPRVVFVNIAANDRLKGDAQYQAQMRVLLDLIFQTYPATKVILLNFHRMTPNRLPVLKELARSYPPGTVMWFDTRPYLVGYSDKGVHPDVESHARLAAALAAHVTKEMLPALLWRDAASMGRDLADVDGSIDE
jgi:hypothetical protein